MRTVPGGNNLINAGEVLERVGVGPGMKVGDFGCGGMGYFTLTTAEMVGDTGMVYAVDILKTVLTGVVERAKAKGFENVKTVWSNLEIYGATKIDADSLDVGMLINILFQTEKDADIIKECVRMIKPGGKLMVIDWKREGAPFGPATEDRVDANEIKRVASSLGLKEVETFEAGPHHFGVIFEK